MTTESRVDNVFLKNYCVNQSHLNQLKGFASYEVEIN